MQSCLILISMINITLTPLISADEKYERKRGYEEGFIKKFGYAGNDLILRNELRNLRPGARAHLCGRMVSDRYYHLGDFPLVETWYIAFRRSHAPILTELLSCTDALALFEGIGDTGNYYVLKKKRIKKFMKVFPPSKKDPYRISQRYSYKVDELNSTYYELPSPVIRTPQYYEPGFGSGSASSSRRHSRESSLAPPRPSAPPLPASRWPSFTAGMRSRSKPDDDEENFRLLR